MCICVFAGCKNVTLKGLGYLHGRPTLTRLYLRDLPDYWLTDAVLDSLHNHTRLKQLDLGEWSSGGGGNSPIQANITAPAVTRSVGLHTHTGSCIPTH